MDDPVHCKPSLLFIERETNEDVRPFRRVTWQRATVVAIRCFATKFATVFLR
jgi:hypothetical protein